MKDDPGFECYNLYVGTNKKNIAIFFGGKSPEHEVSIITGLQVLNNIDTEKYNPIPVYVAKNGKWYYNPKFTDPDVFKDMQKIPFRSTEVTLSPEPTRKTLTEVNNPLLRKKLNVKIDCVFPCFHGSFGENGAFQGLFEITEIPYVGSGILGSALGMDKVVGKDIYKAHNISTAPYEVFHKSQLEEDMDAVLSQLERSLNYPMFVKPAVGGSSIGVTKAKDRVQLKNALEIAATFDSKIIVEQSIENAKEINISVIGNYGGELKVSECEQVFNSGEFLTYDDKYAGKEGRSKGMASTERKIPAEISKKAKSLIQKTAKEVFQALNCCGLVRVDFLLKEDPLEAFVIEINTIPGSMSFYLWGPTGLSFKDMITKLINLSEERFAQNSKNTSTFESNILEDFKPGLKSPKLGQ